MLELGKLAGTRLMEMPKEVLTESVPGKVYHLTIKTEGISDEQKTANVLVSELLSKFNARVIWIRVESGVIEVQLIGSPFAWAALLAFLPSLLAVLGIMVLLISIYSVLSAIPGWAWGLLAVGIGLILFSPSIAKAVTAGRKEYMVAK